MDKLIILLFITFFAQIELIKGQCIANAGEHQIVCSSWKGMDTIQLGGNPSAIGFTPFTYKWEANEKIGASNIKVLMMQ